MRGPSATPLLMNGVSIRAARRRVQGDGEQPEPERGAGDLVVDGRLQGAKGFCGLFCLGQRHFAAPADGPARAGQLQSIRAAPELRAEAEVLHQDE